MDNSRRDLLLGAGGGALAALTLSACGSAPQEGASVPAAPAGRAIQWRMVTSWPANFPGLGTGAARLAELITRASGGRLRVRVHGAGELVPAFEVFDAVSRGSAEMGHSAAYYWKGKHEAAQFFCAVPFGMNAQEINAWFYHGNGLALWRELYARFDLVPFPAGNTGVQLGGWFNRAIESPADLRGLKMRIPGLGGEVLARVGGVPVNVPGGEIFTAMQSGAIDATEWVGPFNDLAFGLHRVARLAYYPGWQEPCATLECMVNKRAFEALPEDLKAIVEACCRAINDDMLAEFTAQNHRALRTLVSEHGVELRPFPPSVLATLREAALSILDEAAARDPFTARVYADYRDFAAEVQAWHQVSEIANYATRG